MSNIKIEGKIHTICDTEYVGTNQFAKRVIVIETSGQYPKTVPVTFLGDKTPILDNYDEDQEVEVSLNLSGNEYNGKWYVNVNGWKIAHKASAPPQNTDPDPLEQPAEAPKKESEPSTANQANIDDVDDDLPF